MGLIDLLRSYFPGNQHERLGPNDLPQDVLNDLNRGAPPHHQQQPRDNEQSFHQGFYQHDSFNNIEEEFETVFRSMDNMFRGMFGFGREFGGFGDLRGGLPESDNNNEDDIFQSFFGNGPTIEYFPGNESPQSDDQEKSLRDKMLSNDDGEKMPSFQEKDDRFNTFHFKFGAPFFGNVSPFDRQMDKDMSLSNEDQNLDEEYGKGNQSIDEILNPRQEPSNDRSLFGIHERSPFSGFSSSMFKSSSITKKINSDGSVETTTRKRDSDGNEEVITSRNIGDQTHTVTNRKNNAGEDERIESFVNMDENDLKTFEDKWNQHGTKGPRDVMIAPPDKLSDMLSSWWKPKL